MQEVFWGIFFAFFLGLSLLIYGAIKLSAGIRDNKIDTATATITGADHYFAIVSYAYAGKSYTAHMRMPEVPAAGTELPVFFTVSNPQLPAPSRDGVFTSSLSFYTACVIFGSVMVLCMIGVAGWKAWEAKRSAYDD